MYGGASVGLMAAVADAALAGGAVVLGVIPQNLADREIAHRGLSELHVTTDMHERKATMGSLSDGFVALPGGFGTLDELAEVATWAQLGIHSKPVGVLDVEGFYQPLLGFLDRATGDGFIAEANRALIASDTNPAHLLDTMAARSAHLEALNSSLRSASQPQTRQ